MESRLKKIQKAASDLFRENAPAVGPSVGGQDRESAHASPRTLNRKLLTGKNILVTGAGRNIGESIALEMAEQGANIYFTDIEDRKIDRLKKKLSEFSVDSFGFKCDISKSEHVDSLCEYIEANNISIDALVNNVGIQFESTSLVDSTDEEWNKIYEVNVLGPVRLTRKVAGSMIHNKTEGSIIFITSIHQSVISGWASYSSSKAAQDMLVKELAISLAPYSIRVNGIAPGWVASDESGRPRKHKYTPLYKSSVQPCYIGRAAVYLTADFFSKHTTGAVLTIDAGLSLHNYRVQQIYPP